MAKKSKYEDKDKEAKSKPVDDEDDEKDAEEVEKVKKDKKKKVDKPQDTFGIFNCIKLALVIFIMVFIIMSTAFNRAMSYIPGTVGESGNATVIGRTVQSAVLSLILILAIKLIEFQYI